MKPSVDKVNIAYFVPGSLIGVAIVVGFGSFLAGKISNSLLGTFVVALWLAPIYVLGYLCWGIGDWLGRTSLDAYLCRYALSYIWRHRYLRLQWVQALRASFYPEPFPETFTTAMEILDPLTEEKPAKTKDAFNELKDLDKESSANLWGTIRTIGWDEMYSRDNEYFVGRVLSDWNNQKLAKAGFVALVFGLLTLGIANWWRQNDLKLIVAIFYGVAAGLYICVVRWRLRVFARSLVRVIAPPLFDWPSGQPRSNQATAADGEDAAAE